MRKFMALGLFMGLLLFVGMAQAEPRAEVFGGYQFTHLDPSTNDSGWNAALTGNFNQWLGVTADFSGAYESGFKFHTYTFGPVVSAHLPIAKPFVHALFGGATASGGGTSSTGFDMMLGGGLDVGHGSLAWRVVQADWMITRFSGFTDKKNTRVSTGIVLRF